MKDLVPRIKALLLQPKETWPLIAADPDDHISLLRKLVVPLAAIPAVASFIGFSLVGVAGFRWGIASGISFAILQFVFGILGVFLTAVVIDKLAPKFEAETNFVQSFKLAAWASVPAFLAGAFLILPFLSILGILGALYGLYLFYLGLPILKRNPEERTVPYLVVAAVCLIVIRIIVAIIQGIIAPSPTITQSDQQKAAAEFINSIKK